MFAVPGWSVSSSALKQQTDPALKSQSQSQEGQGAQESHGKSNKRKRGNDNVTKANVDAMYRRHIEGQKGTPKSQKQGANNTVKAEKKQKKDHKSQVGEASVAEKQSAPDRQPKKENAKALPGASSSVQDNGSKQSKTDKKNKQKNKKKDQQQQEDKQVATQGGESALPAAPPKTEAILTPLQQAMRQKLISSRFRHLNETLYTTPSSKALELFTSNPELFDEYHAGFSRQVKESWPSNPVDGYTAAIRKRAGVPSGKRGNQSDNKKRTQALPLPRRPNGLCTIADLGCGDAALARILTPSAKKLNLKLLSYDLHAPEGSLITKADISNLPIADGSVDLAIFCLSLMGTNWVSFVEEAWRVLRSDGKGECWVSEVKSRFGKVTRKKAQIGARKPLSKSEKKKLKKKNGGDDDPGSNVDDEEIYAEDARQANDDETDISAFVEVFRTRGFVLKPESVDKSNKMFVKMEFVKQGAPMKGKHVKAIAPAAGGAGKKRFIDKTADAGAGMSPEEEARVLKPCVYKIR
ncbi:rRNA processing protein RRP8 [Aspergillus clavatus NRRL 1]|uniref:Ribosomal RNA-processing protein 8 n=1 Tax=Aspergillus clavatus (strain ATCC 1007 / CBS 513.65 / DSM 816 / NCTC 3887 / NRRL 1 / QM 1276 / 107) TaxID=344612 RepID=A1C6I7_ASPCL|nr:rRNA processing protein RRP8 [Aspergillus clavatus NRRL 1]EAW14008.1 rRNA processing protein Rrp8, putative [Aspergillus clavatus NRRL 1]